MKKRVSLSSILVALAILSLTSLVLISSIYAQEEDMSLPEDINKNIGDAEDVKSKTEEVLGQDIKVPEQLQVFTRVLFGVTGEIPLQIFIILIGVWIVLFLIISSILKLTPFFDGAKAWLGGFIVTCLIAITGSIRSIAVFFFNIGNVFSFLEKWSVLKVAVALVIVVILFFGMSIVLKILNKKLMLDRAETEGAEAGAGARLLKETYKEAIKS